MLCRRYGRSKSEAVEEFLVTENTCRLVQHRITSVIRSFHHSFTPVSFQTIFKAGNVTFQIVEVFKGKLDNTLDLEPTDVDGTGNWWS
jgi:hypothetical protein